MNKEQEEKLNNLLDEKNVNYIAITPIFHFIQDILKDQKQKTLLIIADEMSSRNNHFEYETLERIYKEIEKL